MNRLIHCFKEFRHICQRLPITYVLGDSLLTMFQKMLNLQFNKSFAEKGEDIILATMLRKLSSGFYVEVGCYHPIRKSNTFGLYKRGWRGLVIDANPVHLAVYRHMRPKDIVVEAAVSNCVCETELVCFKESAYSTVSKVSAAHVNEQAAGSKHSRIVRTKTLTSILDEHEGIKAFDLLSIDCEDHDFEVLKSLDLVRYRPEIIIIEDHEFSIEHYAENPIFVYLKAFGYKLTGFCLNNLYFRKTEIQKACDIGIKPD